MKTSEVISSEEMLSLIDDLNKLLGEEGPPEEGLCVGSLDVKALYPSLEIGKCARICHDRFLTSDLEFEDVDIKWASIYLALNLKVHQIVRADLQQLVPRRIVSANYKEGKDPTVLTIGVDEKQERERWKWYRDPTKYTRGAKKKVMAKVLEVMIEACFSNHLYKWGPTIRRQRSGGQLA